MSSSAKSRSFSLGQLAAASSVAGVVGFALAKLWNRCCGGSSSSAPLTAAENVYESKRSLYEYLMMHFGRPEELLPYTTGPKDSLEFPLRCAQECGEWLNKMEVNGRTRGLDVGCAVGRAVFEMTPYFDEVVGIDFSQSFIDAANELKQKGSMHYEMRTEGTLTVSCQAVLSPLVKADRAFFEQGDACNLREDLGQFHVVLAANLICRLPKPRDFLRRLPDLVVPGGYVVMPSPYTWLEEFTPKTEWLGGFVDSHGAPVTGAATLIKELSSHFTLIEQKDFPFFIRETARKNQWTVSHLTIWRRKEQ